MIQNYSWFTIRLAALLILATIIIDIEIVGLIISLSFFHINYGIRAIIQDYIHVEKLYLISLNLVRVCYIELIRYSIELII
uniref:Succinate:cytochrome c oxidoreductase subunit 4 n=1 Tax=Pterocladiella media TaxID=1911541 RepID=A0A1D8X7X9_9FLOR|nr:succinate:cytochrome c oxidoreductase subunit 4 [Pterocladiella media]AOX49045.1 succinate:cytochrome c oxidoreductase subunit 4 [Pterocladiella media]